MEPQNYLRQGLTKAAVAGATGIAAIVIGATLGEEAQKKFIMGLGVAGVAAAGMGAAIVYLKSKYMR